jgi:hypothetical protein
MSPQGVVGPGIFGPPGGSGPTANVNSVTASTPIVASPTTGAVVLSWLPTATLSMHTQKLGHLTTPTTPTQATNKSYVDGLAQGLDAKTSVVVVAVANVATLINVTTIDGVVLVAGNRVLLTAQTTPKTNGLWVVQVTAWTRPTTFAAASTQQGAYVLVEEGTTYKGTGWVLTGTAIVVGTTTQTWVKFSNTVTTKVAMGGGVTGTSTACTVAKAPSGSLVAGTNVTISTTSGKAALSATTVALVAHNTGGTLAISDSGKKITVNNATPKTITIPKNATIAIPNLTVIYVEQFGAGQVTVAKATTTVTIHSLTGKVKTAGQYGVISLHQVSANVWHLSGQLG